MNSRSGIVLCSFALILFSSATLRAAVPSGVVFPDSIAVGTIAVGDSAQLGFSVLNNTNQSVLLYAPLYSDAYEYGCMTVHPEITNTISIHAGDSVWIKLNVKVRHNVALRGWLNIRVFGECTEWSSDLLLYGSGSTTDHLYSYNKEYSELYDSLHAHVVNHTNLTYKPAREMMFGKADNVNDTVECIYTGKKLRTTGIPPNGEFNTEHTWVQSRGSSVDPNKSDVNHLYPTNPNANSIRANFPFGNVTKVWKDVGGGSRLGFTATGDTVFEPRLVSKGNIARSIFYYLVRYGNLTDYYTSPYAMDHDLRQWNNIDPPDAREHARCDTIAVYQGKRNPFVDHPEFAERLDFVPRSHSSVLHATSTNHIVDPNQTANQWEANVVNMSPNALRISSVTSDLPQLQLQASDTVTALAPHSIRTLHFNYSKGSSTPDLVSVRIVADNQDQFTVLFKNCATVGVENQVVETSTTVHPLPMQHSCTVELCESNKTVESAQLYSLRGGILVDLRDRLIQHNNHTLLQITLQDLGSEHSAILKAVVNGKLVTRMIIVE